LDLKVCLMLSLLNPPIDQQAPTNTDQNHAGYDHAQTTLQSLGRIATASAQPNGGHREAGADT